MKRSRLSWIGALTALALALPPTAAEDGSGGVRRVPVTLASSVGDGGFEATLLVPDSEEQGLPAVVLQAASEGELGEVGSNALARHLVGQGWAVVELAGQEEAGDFQRLADGIAAAYAWLQDLPRVAGGRIGLIGLGDGAHAVAVAAGRVGEPAFAVAVSGGAAPYGSFDPTSWWWTLDAPLLFVFGDADPTVDIALAKIEEEIRSEGIRVTVEILPGLDATLAPPSVLPQPLAATAIERISRWIGRATEESGG